VHPPPEPTEAPARGRARAVVLAAAGWDELLRLAGSWRGTGLLFAVALAAYWIEALAWPLQRGRDSWDYWLYYLQLLDSHPPFSDVMLFRTPLTPLVIGAPMHAGGAQLLEVVMSLIYAGAVVAWAWAARPFGRKATVIVAVVVLVLQVPYAALFHLASSDFLFGALLPVWAGLVVRSALAPSWPVLVGTGAGAAALTLTRPAGQVIVLAAAAAALIARGSWHTRGVRLAITGAAAVLPLLAWSGVNAARYDDFTFARGGKAWVPFYKVFENRGIDPANGSASRRLADAIEREVLTLPLFRRYDVDVQTYLDKPTNLEAIRLIALSDSEFGRGSDYDVLFDAATEAIKKHPGAYIEDVASTMWDFVTQRFALEPVRRSGAHPPLPATTEVDGKTIASASAHSPLVSAARFGFVWCPTNDIDVCIFRDPSRAFPSPRDQRRYVELTDRVRDWNAQLPIRDGNSTLERRLGTLSSGTPGSLVWIVVALVVLLVRRPRGGAVLALLLVAGALVLLVHALSQFPRTEFALPVAPLFAFVAIAATAAPRARRREADAPPA
jgi:hypothetical protein